MSCSAMWRNMMYTPYFAVLFVLGGDRPLVGSQLADAIDEHGAFAIEAVHLGVEIEL